MAKFQITGPDGGKYEVEAPDDASESQILDYVKSQGSTSFPATPQPKEGTGNAAALLEGAAQGVTFGFSDEIEGGARALYGKITGDKRPIGDIYGETVAKPRARIKEASDTNPWSYHAGEIGAGVAVPGGLARVGIKGALANSAGKPLAARTLAGAKEGTAYGAAYGAGKSEGGTLNMLYDAGMGAGTGMAVGAAIPGAVDVASAIGTRVAAPFRGYMNPKGVAAEKFGEAVSRDVPDAVGGAPRFAEKFEDMLATNPSARAMDAGGDNVRSLMRAAGNMPNEGREGARRLLDARQGNQWVRVENELEATLAPGRAFGETVDELVKKRSQEAAPAFERAYNAPFKPQENDELMKFIGERGYMRRLVEKADETISGMTGKSAPEALTGKAPQASAVQASDLAQIKANIGQLKPGEAESVLDMHRFVREMERAKQPEGLTAFVHRTGGLQDQGGEIKNIIGRNRDRPALIRQHGQALDDAALRAHQQGFFPTRPSINEFLDALDNDAKGLDRVVRQVDIKALDDFKVASDMADDLGRMGITSKMPEDLLRQALGVQQPAAAGAAQSANTTRPWEFLHRVKMEIDREIGRLKSGQQDSKANWTLRDLYGLKDEFQGLMEKRNGFLGSAMKRYADQSSLLNASKDGYDDFLKIPVHDLAKVMAKLSPQEREMYRLGAARKLMDNKLEKGSITRDLTDSAFASPDIQKRLRAIMPDQATLRRFQKSLIVEAKMADSRKALQGNSTTAKQLTEGAEAGKTAQMVTSAMNAASGRLGPALDLVAQGYNRFSGLTPGVANELLRLGLSQNPAAGNALARQSLERASRIPAQRATIGRSAIGGGAAVATQGTPLEITMPVGQWERERRGP